MVSDSRPVAGPGTGLIRLVRSLGKAIDKASGALGLIGGWGAVIASAAIVYEITARYFFNSPTIWAYEVVGYVMVFKVCFGIPYALREDTHITVDTAYSRFPKRMQDVVYIIVSCVALLFVAVMAWQGWLRAVHSYQSGAASSTLVRTPLWIPQSLIPIGFTLFTLEYIVKICRRISSFVAGAR